MSQRAKPKPLNRCAIYTRKSSEEGARSGIQQRRRQREAGELYVKS